MEEGETFFERMFLWVLVSEVIGKSGDVCVLFRRRAELWEVGKKSELHQPQSATQITGEV